MCCFECLPISSVSSAFLPVPIRHIFRNGRCSVVALKPLTAYRKLIIPIWRFFRNQRRSIYYYFLIITSSVPELVGVTPQTLCSGPSAPRSQGLRPFALSPTGLRPFRLQNIFMNPREKYCSPLSYLGILG